jgi:hypothetical protein
MDPNQAARAVAARTAGWPIASTKPRRRSGRRGSVRYRGQEQTRYAQLEAIWTYGCQPTCGKRVIMPASVPAGSRAFIIPILIGAILAAACRQSNI